VPVVMSNSVRANSSMQSAPTARGPGRASRSAVLPGPPAACPSDQSVQRRLHVSGGFALKEIDDLHRNFSKLPDP
jgi:hypothetical protein